MVGALAKAIPAIMKVHNTLGMVDGVIKVIGGDIEKLARTFGQRWYEMNDIAFKTARTMAMSRDQAISYNKQLIDSTRELAAQYGVTAKELADFQQSYAEAVGRNVTLTREQLSHMSALSKITDATTAAKLVDEFDKVGVGIARATAYTGRLQERAKALGVSPSKATKMMADNIKLAASYSFRNGVNDIEKMALKATSMRMDMNAIMSATEKFADIEGAISTSANIQMLGGSFAREFSNPMAAIFESMADPAAFQDRILRTIEGKGTYDAKTGAVTFDPVTMRMMREMAKQLGMSAEQLNTSAMASVQNKKVEEEFAKNANKAGFNEKDIEAIKNLSRTNVDKETGKHFVTILKDGEEKKVNVENLTKEQLKIAQDLQPSQEGLFSDVQEIKDILKRTLDRARDTKSMKEGVEGAKSWWDAQLVNLQNYYMPFIYDIFNGFTNTLGHQYFSEGGIVKPIKAALGAIVPGNSYAGDRVPAMVNSGEMILNKGEQKGLFDLLKSIATTGAMIWGGNKIGKHFGMNGLGVNAALGSLVGGGGITAGGMIGSGAAMFASNKMMMRGMMPMGMGINRLGGTLTLMNPTVMMNGQTIMNGSIGDGSLVEELEDVADAAADVTKNTRSFSMRLRDLSKNDTFLGRRAKGYRKFRVATGRFLNRAKIKIANKFSAGKARALNWYGDTKLGKFNHALRYGTFDQRMYGGGQFRMRSSLSQLSGKVVKAEDVGGKWTQRALRSKGWFQQLGRDTKSLFGGGKSRAVQAVTQAVGKGGKVLSTLGKAGRMVGKGIPILGNALAIGGAISDLSSASSQYDAQIAEIDNSQMSDLEKARAKDRAAKQKNASYGSSIGSAAGTAIGGALGSAFGPLGTMAGMWLGEKAGSFLGKGIGSLFGGNEEKKLKEEQEKIFSQSQSIATGSNDDLLRTVKSIDSKMPSRNTIAAKSIALSPLAPIEMAMSAIKALPDVGIFKKVIPSVSDNREKENKPIGKTDINLNVSGTIKLEGGNKSVDIDITKLLDTPEFRRQLTEIIQKEANTMANAGKDRKEYNEKRT